MGSPSSKRDSSALQGKVGRKWVLIMCRPPNNVRLITMYTVYNMMLCYKTLYALPSSWLRVIRHNNFVLFGWNDGQCEVVYILGAKVNAVETSKLCLRPGNSKYDISLKSNQESTNLSLGPVCWNTPQPWVSPEDTSRTILSPRSSTTFVGQISTSTG